MARNTGSGRSKGWVAPKGGGYSFGTPQKDRDGGSVKPRPPGGTAGVGNLHRKRETE